MAQTGTGDDETPSGLLEQPAADLPKLKRYFAESAFKTQEARTHSLTAIDYYDSDQFTRGELAKLAERSQPPIVINRIKPAINGIIGVVERGRSDPRAWPRNPGNEDAADAATAVLRYVADFNRFKRLKRDCFLDMLVPGTMAALMGVDEDKQVTITQVRWEEFNDALISLNTMKRALFGTVIGPRLSPQDCAGLTAKQAENGGEYQIPAAAFTLTAPLNPRSGARFGVVDANLNFATNTCTVARNGRRLNGTAANVVLNTNGQNVRFWFRGDTGNWVEEADYATADDVIEFPESLIAYLPNMLAVAFAAEFGAELRQDVIAGALEGRQAFARQYARRGRNQADAPIGVPSPAAAG